jgi:putative addiction module component (TIGR02574 family)
MSVDVARTIETVLSLPPEDRLKVVEAVWDSFPEQPVAPTREQQAELNRRIDALEAAPDDLLTWEEVLDDLRSKL